MREHNSHIVLYYVIHGLYFSAMCYMGDEANFAEIGDEAVKV